MKLMFKILRAIYSTSIMKTALLSFLISNMVLLLIFGYLVVKSASNSLVQTVTHHTANEITVMARHMDTYFMDSLSPFSLLAANSSVIALLRGNASMSMQDRLFHTRNIEFLTTNIKAFKYHINDILILGLNGFVKNLGGEQGIKWDYDFTTQTWFQTSVRSDYNGIMKLGIHRSDYYLDGSRLSDNYNLALATKVYDYEHNVLGSIVVNINPIELSDIIENQSELSQVDKNIFLVNHSGQILAHHDARQIGNYIELEQWSDVLNEKSGHFLSEIGGEDTLVVFSTSLFTDWKLVSFIPLSEITRHSEPLKQTLYQVLLICSVLNIIMTLIIALKVYKPVKKLLRNLQQMNDGEVYTYQRNYKYEELNFIGNKFKELLERIKRLVEQNYAEKIRLQQAEFSALQSQIKPHFLFNTLQMLQTEIVYGNIRQSNDIILSLSQLLRYSMDHSTEYVDLRTELQSVKNYLTICHSKFGSNLEVNYFINESTYSCKIQKLILQPIVENSIKHGFEESPLHGKIDIYVDYAHNKEDLLITIRDNGKGINNVSLLALNRKMEALTENTNSGIGLINVHQRIRIKHGIRYGLKVISESGYFTEVQILIPANKE